MGGHGRHTVLPYEPNQMMCIEVKQCPHWIHIHCTAFMTNFHGLVAERNVCMHSRLEHMFILKSYIVFYVCIPHWNPWICDNSYRSICGMSFSVRIFHEIILHTNICSMLGVKLVGLISHSSCTLVWYEAPKTTRYMYIGGCISFIFNVIYIGGCIISYMAVSQSTVTKWMINKSTLALPTSIF